MKKYIGIDIGGTYIKYGLLDETGNILHKDKLRTSLVGEEIIQSIKEIVENYQKEHVVQAVGVSAPGVVEASGFMTTGGAIFDFYGIDLKKILEKKLKLPVTIENDANSAALAEKWLGAGQAYQNFFTVVVGTGVGGSIIINNDIYRGAHATAGEFGFMVNQPIKNNDTRMASVSLNSSVQSGLVQAYLDAHKHVNTHQIDGETIFLLAASGDELALQIIDTFYQNLALAIYNISVSFDPEVILLGGGISSNSAFIEELNHRIRMIQDGHRDMKNMTLSRVLPCKFLNDAGIVGATYKAMKQYGGG